MLNKQAVINKSLAGAAIKIACEGTSLTYGVDVFGTDTTHAPASFGSGGLTRAIYQYPQTIINDFNNPKITLSMRGYPGDRTTEGITRWQDSTSADVCILEYGTNDAYNFAYFASGTVPLSTYKTQLELLAKRRINQGAWVIICIPPDLANGDTTINAYQKMAAAVAKELDVDAFNVEASILQVNLPYSDNVHFNSKGYKKWGDDMMGILNVIK